MADELTNVYGIDVSNNNGRLNLSQFSGLKFVFAKATEGTTFIDDTFSYYKEQAASRGLLFGAYHYAHPEKRQPVQEARLFIDNCSMSSEMPVWIDYEEYSGDPAYDIEWLNLFNAELQDVHAGIHVGLYADLVGMNSGINQLEGFSAYWLAYYNNNPETSTGPMPRGYVWAVHQYEVFNSIDRDYSRYSVAQLKEIFKWG